MYTIHIAGQDFPWPSRNLLFVGDVHCSTQHILPLGMFVLMYEHCMYIVQSFHLTVFYLKYCRGFNASWESRIFEIKLTIPGF